MPRPARDAVSRLCSWFYSWRFSFQRISIRTPLYLKDSLFDDQHPPSQSPRAVHGPQWFPSPGWRPHFVDFALRARRLTGSVPSFRFFPPRCDATGSYFFPSLYLIPSLIDHLLSSSISRSLHRNSAFSSPEVVTNPLRVALHVASDPRSFPTPFTSFIPSGIVFETSSKILTPSYFKASLCL